MPDYSYLHGRFDHTFRVGRCPNRRCTVQLREGAVGIVDRPAYAWKANTGLKLDDGLKCPRCGSLLNRTSRDALRLREFTVDEYVKVYETTLANLRDRETHYREVLAAWEQEEPGERRDFNVGAYKGYLDEAIKHSQRVEKGYSRFLSSGSDEHDAAVRSIGGQ